MIDRKTAPALNTINCPQVPDARVVALDNGATLHILTSGTQNVVKLDIVLGAGTTKSAKPLVANATNTLTAEGTRSYASVQVSEIFDSYGAYIWQNTSTRHAVLSVCSLTRYFSHIMPVLDEVVRQPVFPQSELDLYLARTRQEMMIEMQKPGVMAARAMRRHYYRPGSRHDRVAELADYDRVSRADLVGFHSECYRPADAHIFVSGRPDAHVIDSIADRFGSRWQGGAAVPADVCVDDTPAPNFGRINVDVAEASQTSIKMALPVVGRRHPDFIGLSILSTILGGYFGSRLMKNIREEKGLTYGIGSSIQTTETCGTLSVTSSVKSDLSEQALSEIYAEVERLRTEPVGVDELTNVSNYLRGEMLRSLDGAFATSDQIRGLTMAGVDPARYFADFYSTLAAITPARVQELAVQYLVPSEFRVVMAG